MSPELTTNAHQRPRRGKGLMIVTRVKMLIQVTEVTQMIQMMSMMMMQKYIKPNQMIAQWRVFWVWILSRRLTNHERKLRLS